MRRIVGGLALGTALLLPAAPGAAQETHILTVVGLGGDPSYTEDFIGWGRAIRVAALGRWGLDESQVTLLAEDPTLHPEIDGRSDREGVEAAVAGLADRAAPADRILLVLIGHGSFRQNEARFNLPGRDLNAREWDALLEPLGDRQVAVVNAASASGPFIQALAAEGRTVITATRTGAERNETQFARFFAEALAEDGADLDRDGMLSLLEAFTWTRGEVARWYEEERLLLTEHAVLEDNGDGEGSEEPGLDGPDGILAATFRLVPRSMRVTAPEFRGDSVTVRLMTEIAELEAEVARLRARQSEMDPDAYEAALEELVLEIALKNRELTRRREGGS
jgi:hypothetical protein